MGLRFKYPNNVSSLLLLKDKRVASCSDEIIIFEPSNNCHCEQILKRHRDGITSICELDDGTIISSSYDKSVIIGDFNYD